MELAGHECVGFCEFDKYAVMSYTAMHLCTQEQLDYLATLPLKQRQKEILKDEYKNGEWYADDVRRVDARDIPEADCWYFGFPCQDISVANKLQLGFQGSRSSLFFRIMYLLGQIPKQKRPSYLFIENVINLLSVNRGWDFARLLTELDGGGSAAEWEVLNSKDFGVPHSRKRVFVVGRFRERSTAQVLPVGRGTENSKDSPGVPLTSMKVKRVGFAYNDPNNYKSQAGRIYSIDGISPTLKTPSGGGSIPMIINDGEIRSLTPKECFRLQGWTDDYFEKAQLVNSDTQLYKQAGNGVTVNVVEAIAKKMKQKESTNGANN